MLVEMKLMLMTVFALHAVLLGHLGDADPRGSRSEGARECLRRSVRAKIFEELGKMTDHMVNTLPKDGIRHLKLLPKLGKSMEKTKGISVLKEILKFYSEDVFCKESLEFQAENENIQLLLSTLEMDVEHCLKLHPSALDPKEQSDIENMRKTFIELKDKGVYKAIGEFKTVLDWIESYIHMQKWRGMPTQEIH